MGGCFIGVDVLLLWRFWCSRCVVVMMRFSESVIYGELLLDSGGCLGIMWLYV